jgi:hypothetical protein
MTRVLDNIQDLLGKVQDTVQYQALAQILLAIQRLGLVLDQAIGLAKSESLERNIQDIMLEQIVITRGFEKTKAGAIPNIIIIRDLIQTLDSNQTRELAIKLSRDLEILATKKELNAGEDLFKAPDQAQVTQEQAQVTQEQAQVTQEQAPSDNYHKLCPDITEIQEHMDKVQKHIDQARDLLDQAQDLPRDLIEVRDLLLQARVRNLETSEQIRVRDLLEKALSKVTDSEQVSDLTQDADDRLVNTEQADTSIDADGNP